MAHPYKPQNLAHFVKGSAGNAQMSVPFGYNTAHAKHAVQMAAGCIPILVKHLSPSELEERGL